MIKGVTVVAEVKTRSPFGFASSNSWEEQFAIAKRVGDIVSIHTDSRWGGSFRHIGMARRSTQKPILAKGMHATDFLVKEAVRAGADYVLVVGRIPKVHRERCWIEPYSLEELIEIPREFKVVWNARDLLRGGRQKTETFEEARQLWDGWLCQASFIKCIDDVKAGADAILVGEGLEGFARSIR